MCVLGCLVESPSYGYELLQKLEEAGMPAGSEASIYLVLKRMKKHDLVEAVEVEAVGMLDGHDDARDLVEDQKQAVFIAQVPQPF